MRGERARKFRTESGFSIIELLISVVILSIAMVAIAGLNGQLARQGSQQADLLALDIFRRRFPIFISDDESWKVTVARNANMACLSGGNGAACPVFQKQAFVLYDANSRLVYRPTDPANGVTILGLPCGPDTPLSVGDPTSRSRQAAAFPSRECPMHYDLEWVALDNNPVPYVAIIVTLNIGRDAQGSPYAPLIMNPDAYAYAYHGPFPPAGQAMPDRLIYRQAVP